MSKFTVPYFNSPDAHRPSFDDVFGIDEHKERRAATDNLHPTFAGICRSFSPSIPRVASGYPDDWPRCPSCGDFALDGHITCGRVECDEFKERRERGSQEKMMSPDHSKRGIFVYHRCWKCDDGARPCVNGTPNRCDYPRARNE